ncbi:N-6 DNA methylase [Paenibacillus sp. HGF5]|uniref:N-6 DNA methylase n=1 Tax=Paenibacillus sp. HGF5 TaxID=908341 RepID=UPI0002072790|nr:N-6 DNA methylase [Paenibacillus sp. HGF5]EGG34832.1 conserved domain protein [Paenibacillus sp. HGF5]
MELIKRSKKKWPGLELVGVDIQKSNDQGLVQDGRLYSFECFQKNKLFDLVLANPPFEVEKLPLEIKTIIQKLFPNHGLNGNVFNRLESTMMLFNSLLVKPDGTLASVVPISLLNAENQVSLRRYFADTYHLDKIIYLPDDAFGAENIRTALVLLKKSASKKHTTVYLAIDGNQNYITKKVGSISRKKILDGLWQLTDISSTKISNDISIIRNNISSNQLKKEGPGLPVIHTGTIFNGSLRFEKMRYLEQNTSKLQYVKAGDIVVNRVGKSIGEFALIETDEEKFLSSDSVLIVRPSDQTIRDILINKLKSADFSTYKKGVTTKYITKNDIYSLLS